MRKQMIITTASPQGGSGKSTIAVNLAIQFAKENFKVLLMDFAGYGSIPSMLKIPIRGKGMSSLITAMEQNHGDFEQINISDYFRDAVLNYEVTKQLHLLMSASPLKMEKLNEFQTEKIIETAKNENYQIIIIDTSSELCERNIACIENSDLIIIPTLQDVTSGWKIILFKEILDSLHIEKERIGLMVNRCTKYSGFNNKDFQTEIGYSIIGEFSDFSKIIPKYVNSGIPLANCGKRSIVSQLQLLAKQTLKKVGG